MTRARLGEGTCFLCWHPAGSPDEPQRDTTSTVQVDSEKLFGVHSPRVPVSWCSAAATSLITIYPTIAATYPRTKFSAMLDKDAYGPFCLCSYPAASCILDFSTLIRAKSYQQLSGSTCISFPPSPPDPSSVLDVEILCSNCSDLLSRRCSAALSNKTLAS